MCPEMIAFMEIKKWSQGVRKLREQQAAEEVVKKDGKRVSFHTLEQGDVFEDVMIYTLDESESDEGSYGYESEEEITCERRLRRILIE